MTKSLNKPPLGVMFRMRREEKELLVRQVAAVTDMDQATISRIENGDRLPTREQLMKLAGLYGLDLKETYAAWLAEKMIREYGSEDFASEAFLQAHRQMPFLASNSAVESGIQYSMTSDARPSLSNPFKGSPAKRGPKPKKPGPDDPKP